MSKNIMENAKILRVFLFLLIFAAVIMLSPFGIMNVIADEIMTTVPVGTLPNGVAVNTDTNRIYVTSGNANNSVAGKVTVIDGTNDSVITTLDVGGTPKGMAVDEANNKIYVANMDSNSVMVIDGDSNTVSTLAAINRPVAVARNATTGALYVANCMDIGTVTVLDGSTGDVVTEISVAPNPCAVALNSNTNAIYVAHENSSGTVTVIDGSTDTVSGAALTVGSYPEGVAVNEVTNKIYVANAFSGNVTVIDGGTNMVEETVAVGSSSNPWGVAVNECTNKIYVADQTGSVTVIDGNTNTVAQTLDIQGYGNPIAVAVDQTSNKIYVPSLNTNNLTVIDGSIIEAASVAALTAPAAGETPEAAIDLTPGDGRYSVSDLSWENLGGAPATLDGSGKFANAGNTYQARIELTAGAIYKFPADGPTPTVNTGIPAAGTVSGGETLGNKLTFVVTFPADITTASLTGLPAPETGVTPAGVSVLSPGNPAQYTVTSLTWLDTGGNPATFDDSDGKFPYGGSWFQARIVLTSQPGYKFPAGGLTPAVAGDGTAAPGTVGGGDVSGNTLTFVASFSDDIFDYEAYISGLNPPATGETPQAAGDLTVYETGHHCYVSGLTWENSDGSPATLSGGKFISGGSTYKAVVELTSQPGYKFPPGGFTPTVDDDGTFVSGAVSGGYVTGNKFTFEITFSNEITAAGITGLAAPVKGAVPITEGALTAGDSALYEVGYMEWVNNDGSSATLTDGKFKADSTYKAKIYLDANDGYKFPVSGLTPTVDAGTPTSGTAGGYASGNTLIFEVTFPATAPDSVGGGGHGGAVDTTPNGTPETETSDGTTTVTTTVTAETAGNGKTTASVTKNQLSEAVSSAVAEADKQGSGTKAVVEIKVDAPSNSSSVATAIPKDAVGTVASGGADALKISTPVASISFDADALNNIYDEASGDVKITTAKVDASTLTDETKQLVGDRPVFNFSVTSGNDSISEFGGNVTVSVSYTPKAGEDTDAIVIYYINSEGKPEAVANCKYDPATKTVSFTTNHFSKYAVGYNKVSFSDVKTGAWYENAVDFVAARGIVTGTGNGNYDPNGKLTRAQLLVMLMRAYGIGPDTDLSGNFSDAGNTYYTGYLAAAKRLGITEGLGNNLYAPDKQITRQEMFTLLNNTLNVIGQLPEGAGKASGALTGYSDADSVASWAKDAAGTLANAGIIGGSNGNLLPKNTTTRAEMAQVLYNLLKE